MSDQIDGEPSSETYQQTSSPMGEDIFGESSVSDVSGELVNNKDEEGDDENGEQIGQEGIDDENDPEQRDEEMEVSKDISDQEGEEEEGVGDEVEGEDGDDEKGNELDEEEGKEDGPLEKSTEDESQEGDDSMEKDEAADQSGADDEEPEAGKTKKKRRLMIDDDEDEEEDEDEDNENKDEDNEDKDAEGERPTAKSIGLETDDEDEKEEGEGGADDGDEGKAKKKRRLIVNDDDDSDEEGEKGDKDEEDKEEKEDDDQLDKSLEAEVKEREGDDDEEEEEAGESSKIKDPAVPDISSEDESDDDSKRRSKVPDDFVYDFDLMMARKKEESFRSRKRKNIDIINDNDDIIADLITQMKQSADEDFELNKNRKAATCKLRLLPVVETQLRKIDLRESFLDAGVLGVITDWLTPLPDRSLPNLQVRETMLKLLGEFNIMDVERLKASGIGKAVMYLYKHPKETKDNKKRAGVLISSWSRPIFSLDTDFHTMSKEEREQRDFDHMTKLTENKRGRTEPKTPPSSSRKVQAESEKVLRPGDKGWIPRARVPAPSTRDYVVRPKSNVDSEMSRSGSKKAVTRLDKHLRNFREKKKLMKTQRAVPISIEGRRMTL